MKKLSIPLLLLLLLNLSSCEVIGGIFKAGALTGVIVVVAIIAIIIWIVSSMSGKS